MEVHSLKYQILYKGREKNGMWAKAVKHANSFWHSFFVSLISFLSYGEQEFPPRIGVFWWLSLVITLESECRHLSCYP